MVVVDDATFLDLLAELDREYQRVIQSDGETHDMDFMDGKILSLLQLLWNPATRQFYSDVGVEARTAPPESDSIPMEQPTGWKMSLPDQSWVILTPDAGC
jgi:hypothetical protein